MKNGNFEEMGCSEPGYKKSNMNFYITEKIS